MDAETILRDLIRINTMNPPGNELDIVKKILSYFPDDINYEIFDHGDNRGTLIITVYGKKDKAIGFLGHLDTVPVSDANTWQYDPFEGVVVDGYMYGRGATDMKGGITSMICTALYFIERDIIPNYTIKFIFTSDEESSGLGILELKNKGKLEDLIEVIICEPSDGLLGIKEKGALWINIEAFGIASHASKPELGINAIDSLLDIAFELKKSIDLDLEDELLGKATFEITTIHGGIKTNIIPDYAKLDLDIRTIPGINNEDIILILEKIINKYEKGSKLKIKYRINNNRLPLQISKTNKFIKKVSNSFKRNKKDIQFTGINFYTDGSLFLPEKNIPFVITGPGFMDLCHQRDEYVKLSQVNEYTKIYIDYILDR